MHRVERRGFGLAGRKQNRGYDNELPICKIVIKEMLISCSPCLLRIGQDTTRSIRL